MKYFRVITALIAVITIIFLSLITFFTINAIGEEPNRINRLDFTNKHEIISSYATLISGLLTFLSILFVIYALVVQKNESLIKEKQEKKSYKQGLIEHYNVLVYYLNSLLESIEVMNKSLKEFTTDDLNHPTLTNHLLLEINKNFTRIIDMDVKSTFNAFHEIYQGEKVGVDFVNLYKYIDFYSELYFSVKNDYESTRQFKYEKLTEFGFEVLELYNKKADLIDSYKDEFPNIYKHKPWVEISSKSIGDYYKYIADCEKKKEQNDFDYISNSIFGAFLHSALLLRDSIGYGKYNEKDIVRITSTLRKKLFYIKGRVFNNAQTLEKIRIDFLDEESEDLKYFKKLVLKMERFADVENLKL